MVSVEEIAKENQRKILTYLSTGPKTWRELKEFTGFADGTLAKHLKRLLEDGLITEEISKKDRRIKIYKITNIGEQELFEDMATIEILSNLALVYTELVTDPIKNGVTEIDLTKFYHYIGTLYFYSINTNLVKPYLKALEIFADIIKMHEKIISFEVTFKLIETGEIVELKTIFDVLKEKDINELKSMVKKEINNLKTLQEKIKKTVEDTESILGEKPETLLRLNEWIQKILELNPIFKKWGNSTS